jgi:NAD(P)-dependent dehydrogenase (short-subunit alcohol dehydrogenase family)
LYGGYAAIQSQTKCTIFIGAPYHKDEEAMQLHNQHVVVVGGSKGIGLAVAQQARQAGARVTIVARSAEQLANAATSFDEVETIALDVMDEAGLQAAFARISPIDHVYVAAGRTQLGSILEGTVNEQLDPLVERLWGSVHVVRAAVPHLTPGGSITFTGGLSTDRPVAGAWVSGVATAAAEQLARVLALELAPLRFNAISPGYTDTPMWDAVLGEARTAVLAGVAERLPVRHIATPAEVASAVILLMTNPSMTGAVLHVDGGARLV